MLKVASRNDPTQRNQRSVRGRARTCWLSRRHAGLLRRLAWCFVSALTGYAYLANAGTTTGVNFSGGFANSQGQMILNGNAQLNGSALQLTNGGTDEAGSAWFATPVNVQSFSTNFTFQLSNPAADGITFTLQGQG